MTYDSALLIADMIAESLIDAEIEDTLQDLEAGPFGDIEGSFPLEVL